MTAKVFAAGLVALVAFGCTDPPTTSTALNDEVAPPAFKTSHVEYSFPYSLDDEVPFLVCRGELVQGHGTLMIHIREVTTPSGNLLVRGRVEYPGDTWMEGLVTGVVWTFEKGLNPYTETLKGDFYSGDDFWVQNWTIHEWYTNPALGKLKVSWWGGFKYDKDGNLTINRDNLTCE